MSRRGGVKAALGAPEVAQEYERSKNKRSGKHAHDSKYYKKHGKSSPYGSESSGDRSRSKGKGRKSRSSGSGSRTSSSDLDASVKREAPVPFSEPSHAEVKRVEFVKPLSDRVKWSEAVLTYSLDGSLASHKSNANGSGHVPLIIGQGVMPEKLTPDLAAQIQSKMSLHSRSAVFGNPSKVTEPKHFIRDVVIEGSHNGYPVGLRFEVPNFKASQSETCYINSEGKAVDHLTVTLMPGETRSEKTILDNKCDTDMLNVYSDYPNFTADNLRADLKEAPQKNGIERWSVPHTEKERHPVIDIAASKMVKEKQLNSKQKRAYERTGEIPPELLEASKDDPTRTFISKALFDQYEPRVQKGMKGSAPLSDMSHPYGLVSRVGNEQVTYADTATSKSKLDAVGSKEEFWTNSREAFANRSSKEAKDNVMSTDYKAWVRVRVRFANSKDIHQRLDK